MLHATMLVLIWLKFLSVLITNRKSGPLIRMIYLMGKDISRFYIILFGIILCAAGVFCSIFNDKTNGDQFKNFKFSFRTMFSSSLGGFDLSVFTEDRYFGEIIYGIFQLMTYVMMLNLLIAILTNVYEMLIDRVDAEYRSVLIN
jgi:hypothetical protein